VSQPESAPHFKRLVFHTYLAVIKNAPGTAMFRNFYLERPNGTEFDAIGDGNNACAFFVSSVLTIFAKVKDIHGTVDSTKTDLQKSGWVLVSDLQPGDVISWEPRQFHDGRHGHIGFYLGENRAVSTSASRKVVAEHDLYYGAEKRRIVAAYRYPEWE